MKLHEFENCKNITESILEIISANKLKVTYLDMADSNENDYIYITIGCVNKINEEHLTKVIEYKFRYNNLANVRFTKFGDITRIGFNLGIKDEE